GDDEAGRDAVVLDIPLPHHRAAIDEGVQEDAVLGPHRHLVLEAVEEQEVAADLEPFNRARPRLHTELLAGPAQGVAAERVVDSGRRLEDVEVTLVQHDAARQVGVGVAARAECQTARWLFLPVHAGVLGLAVGSVQLLTAVPGTAGLWRDAPELEPPQAVEPARIVPPERRRVVAEPLPPVHLPGSRRGGPAGTGVASTRAGVSGDAPPKP